MLSVTLLAASTVGFQHFDLLKLEALVSRMAAAASFAISSGLSLYLRLDSLHILPPMRWPSMTR